MSTKKTVRKKTQTVAQKNAAFMRMSPAGKRVAVSKDVLSMFSRRKLRAVHGEYVVLPKIPKSAKVTEKTDARDAIKKLPPCQVCAVGAAMVCGTLKLDNVNLLDELQSNLNSVDTSGKSATTSKTSTVYFDESDVGEDTMSARALDIFDENLLRIMETAFEFGGYGYERVARGSRRLVAIYKNIVANRGKKFTEHARGGVKGATVWAE
jgi:hypothetical protein